MTDNLTHLTGPDPALQPPRKPRKPLYRRWYVAGPAGLLAAIIALSVGLGCSHATAAKGAAPAPPATSQPATKAPAAKPTHSTPANPAPINTNPAPVAPAPSITYQPVTPAPAPTHTTKPAAPAGPTTPQQQALESAQSYLDLGNGFSRGSLIDQLKYEKFSEADAAWAADHSGADWYAQAVMSAKSYMDLKTGFSRGSLIEQLQYEQFTYDQASHAASHVGL